MTVARRSARALLLLVPMASACKDREKEADNAPTWHQDVAPIVAAALEANPDVADKIRDGKVAAAGALIGQVMKTMKGQADAGAARAIIMERLGQS